MEEPKLEDAAARLAACLRSSPADGIEERLQARIDSVRELRARAAAEWTPCRTAVEGLIADVATQRARALGAATDFIDGLKALFPSLDAVASEASGACEGAAGLLRDPLPRFADLRARLDTEVERWTSQSGGFVVGIVEDRASRLAGAQAALAQAIGVDLRLDLQGRLTLLKDWRARAGETADVATESLNTRYEEWAVRLAQVAALAASEGRDRFSAHAAEAAEAAVEAAPAALQEPVGEAETVLQSARESLVALSTAMQSVPAEVAENLQPAFDAIGAVAETTAETSEELVSWTGRLQLFAPGGAS